MEMLFEKSLFKQMPDCNLNLVSGPVTSPKQQTKKKIDK